MRTFGFFLLVVSPFLIVRAILGLTKRNNPVDVCVWPEGVQEDTFSDKLR